VADEVAEPVDGVPFVVVPVAVGVPEPVAMAEELATGSFCASALLSLLHPVRASAATATAAASPVPDTADSGRLRSARRPRPRRPPAAPVLPRQSRQRT
jgi:hypothetical protein